MGCKNLPFLAIITITLLSLPLSPNFLHANLIEIKKINPTIKLDIRYATANNFTGKVIYPSAQCFLEKEAALALDAVQKELNAKGYGLKIFDGYRPLSVQKIFWEIYPDEKYVANPAKGSKHNRGTAVDLTLIDIKSGKELKMPSEFDEFSSRANRNYPKMDNATAKHNCKLLESIMEKHGFIGLTSEWWHFDYKNWKKYPIQDISFTELEKQKTPVNKTVS
ncbi:MAG: D-alanyl-D-alanine dipeptidase [bacterium]